MGPPPDSGSRIPEHQPAAASAPAAAAAASAPLDLGGSEVTKPVANRMPMLIGLGVVALIAVVGGFFALNGGGSDGGDDTAAGDTSSTTEATGDEPVDEPVGEGDTSTTTEAPDTSGPTDDELTANAEAVIVSAGLGDELKVEVVDGVATVTGTVSRSVNSELLSNLKEEAGVSAFANDDTLVVVEDDEWCSPTVKANERYACITSAVWDGSMLNVLYDTENKNEPLSTNGSYHYHFFPSETPVANSGVIAAGAESEGSIAGPGWDVHGDFAGYSTSIFGKVGKICVRIANPGHAIESLTSGNCWPVTDES